MREKVKLLVKSNFSFPHHVFKILVQPTRKNKHLLGKRLHDAQSIYFKLDRVENIVRKLFSPFSDIVLQSLVP